LMGLGRSVATGGRRVGRELPGPLVPASLALGATHASTFLDCPSGQSRGRLSAIAQERQRCSLAFGAAFLGVWKTEAELHCPWAWC